MSQTIKDYTEEELKEIIRYTVRETIENIFEDYFALSSDNFIKSIEKSRKEYKQGKFVKIEDAFDV